jgi:hypothetical protein
MGHSRRLREAELELIAALLAESPQRGLSVDLHACMVEDMQDGGMGSLRFVASVLSQRFV